MMNKNVLSQSFFIPRPTLTEDNLPDQSNKVFIVSGGYSGIGYELVKILYRRNGIVYIAGRSPRKGSEAITRLKGEFPEAKGRLEFLQLDLSDLSTIKGSAHEFLSKEERLDVLTNNAGVGSPPAGSVNAQGHELQLGTNCLGPFLFTQLLLPILKKTAATSPEGSVRVTWAGSLTTETSAPPGGVSMGEGGIPAVSSNQMTNYGQSKAGNVFIASEFARRYGRDGILSVAWNPGNLRTDLTRHMSWLQKVSIYLLTYPSRLGAYTELYAGWSSNITLEDNGSYIIPWGRLGSLRADLQSSLKSEADNGSGKAAMFWKWCEGETKQFL